MTAPATRPKTYGLAIAALICAVVFPPVGLVLGVIALIHISNSNGALGGKEVAIVAICLPVVSIAILGIFAAIAIPNFIRFQLRAKTAEARVVLGGLRMGEEAFRAERGAYLAAGPTPDGAPTATKTPWPKIPCPAACKDDIRACTDLSCLGYEPGPSVYYRYQCVTMPASGADDPPEFACAAVGDVDGDQKKAAFVYGSANGGGDKIRAPIPEIARSLCKGVIPANEVVDCTPGTF